MIWIVLKISRINLNDSSQKMYLIYNIFQYSYKFPYTKITHITQNQLKLHNTVYIQTKHKIMVILDLVSLKTTA